MNLSTAAKVTRVSDAVAAGQTTINSSSIDMQGFLGVMFTVLFGSITAGAVTSVKLQGSSDDTNWSDLEGTGQTVAVDAGNKAVILDTGRNQHRYIRCVVVRGTQDSVVDGILSQQYTADKEPVTHDSTVASSEFVHAPAAGNA